MYNTVYFVSIFREFAYRRWEVLGDIVLCWLVETRVSFGSVKINRT